MDEQKNQVTAEELAGEKMVDEAFQRLLNSYLASRHRKKVDIITKAFNFARQAHKGVKRLSGEPYIMHPIAVALIASEEMGLGSTSICSALLHDVVEDTDYTVEDISNIFGPKIAQIVDGLTKISGGIFGEQASAQAENFKKLLLTMSDDIRVILIKICDRLHNMRTLASQPANKQYKIAGETLYIYAPLANRLGLNKIKSELENLSFRFEHPEEYARIESQLAETAGKRDELFANFISPIEEALNEMGLKHRIIKRVKSPYSIWNKMQTKHVTFDQIYDILAVRIIFTPTQEADEINECFDIYVALTKIYKSHPDRLREWLNHPKANGYQALHVTLMSGEGRWIEVQIRSERMDEVAEQGFAAHWKYKEGEEIAEDEGELGDWLSTIKEILDDPQPDAMDFLDAIKLNLFASEIFVFTPKGEIKTMPAGCTALDFAFQIHTFLGSHCIGAKVNHKLVPLSHKLESGDQVEILTSNSQHVQPSWVNFVSTAKAKGKIQAILRRDSRETQKQGEIILKDFLTRNDLEMTTSVLDKLCEIHETPKHEDLFLAIGLKNIILGEKDIDEIHGKNQKDDNQSKGWRRYVPFVGKKKDNKEDKDKQQNYIVVGKDFNRKKPVYINENNISQFIFPSCCHPIPGEDIVGFITKGRGVSVHRKGCHTINHLSAEHPERLVEAVWGGDYSSGFSVTVGIIANDRAGLLRDITTIIANEKINVLGVRSRSDTKTQTAQMDIDMEVFNINDLNRTLARLNNMPGILSAKRL